MQTLTRRKKRIEGMMPVKEWLNTDHAADYLEMSRSKFITLNHNFAVAMVGKTKMYSVTSLKKYIESRVIVNAV